MTKGAENITGNCDTNLTKAHQKIEAKEIPASKKCRTTTDATVKAACTALCPYLQ